jgi:hypothetical protein
VTFHTQCISGCDPIGTEFFVHRCIVFLAIVGCRTATPPVVPVVSAPPVAARATPPVAPRRPVTHVPQTASPWVVSPGNVITRAVGWAAVMPEDWTQFQTTTSFSSLGWRSPARTDHLPEISLVVAAFSSRVSLEEFAGGNEADMTRLGWRFERREDTTMGTVAARELVGDNDHRKSTVMRVWTRGNTGYFAACERALDAPATLQPTCAELLATVSLDGSPPVDEDHVRITNRTMSAAVPSEWHTHPMDDGATISQSRQNGHEHISLSLQVVENEPNTTLQRYAADVRQRLTDRHFVSFTQRTLNTPGGPSIEIRCETDRPSGMSHAIIRFAVHNRKSYLFLCTGPQAIRDEVTHMCNDIVGSVRVDP